MKATGIIRRIDDLGRVVIPREIRRVCKFREGDPLEIFVDREGGIILKKYSPIGELSEFAQEYTDSLYETIGYIALITDKDNIIAVSGCSKKDFLDKVLWIEIETVMANCEYKVINEDTIIYNDQITLTAKVIIPIISEGDVIGTVVLCSKKEGDKMGDVEIKLAQTAAKFLAKQMED